MIDKFILAESNKFLVKGTEDIRKVLVISKIEDLSFRFTGIDMKKFEDRIEL